MIGGVQSHTTLSAQVQELLHQLRYR